jgi:lipopolysaccharide/colanic/teichoic acid biosynthesis glycosyltransferase
MRNPVDAVRRALDVLVASSVLVVAAPLWGVIAVVVRYTSPGPILYAGRRVGLNGRPFAMYKFRTMRVGADRSGPGITGSRDPRVTPVGRLLRATKLDELPQLVNVVQGDMSLVGPRPEAPEYVALYDDRQRRVLTVRPGITGPTQLLYRHEERLLQAADVDHQYRTELLPKKLESDLRYVADRTLWGDIRLIVATAGAVLRVEPTGRKGETSGGIGG